MTKDKLTIGQGESLPAACAALWRENRLPFLSGLLAGLAAHGYAFGNKLLNHDEIESLFGKGATVTSGRWGLELVKLLFPDWSMPWIYGLVSLVLIGAAACLMLRTLDIRSAALRILQRQGSMSRKRLSEIIKLTPAAITKIVGEMLAEGLLTEGAAVRGGGAGRREILLQLEPRAGCALGVLINLR